MSLESRAQPIDAVLTSDDSPTPSLGGDLLTSTDSRVAFSSPASELATTDAVWRPNDGSDDAKAVKINWDEYENSTLEGFKQAIKEGKPMVLVLSDPSCPPCIKLESDLKDPKVRQAYDAMGEDAVFVYANPIPPDTRGDVQRTSSESQQSADKPYDPVAHYFASKIQSPGYPVVAVIEPNAGKMEIRGEIIGYHKPEEMARHLAEIIYDTPPRTSPPPQPEVVSV